MKRNPALPPGPSAPEWFQTIAFSQSPFEYMRGCSRRYGDTYTLRMAGMGDVVMFGAPEGVREVFGISPDAMHNGNDVVRYLLHERSVIFLEGEEHRQARKILTPPFHGVRLEACARHFIDSARGACAEWTDGETVNLHRTFQQATFDALLKALFGEAELAGGAGLRTELLNYVNGQLTNGMFFASVLFGPRLYAALRGRTERARAELDRGRAPARAGFLAGRAANLAKVESLLERVIAARKSAGAEGEDALGRMLASGSFSDSDAALQLLTLLIAGHDTTSLSLSWLMTQILERPDVYAQLVDEVLSVRDGGELDAVAVAKLPYLGAVISESLRYTPIAAFVPRRIDKEARVGGVAYPAGTCLAANVIAAHSRAESWGDPEQFRPERFLEGEPGPGSFIPFGGGARRCLGAAFATSEMRFVVAQLLSEWDFELAPGYKAKPAIHGFLIGPAKPVRAVVRRRKG